MIFLQLKSLCNIAYFKRASMTMKSWSLITVRPGVRVKQEKKCPSLLRMRQKISCHHFRIRAKRAVLTCPGLKQFCPTSAACCSNLIKHYTCVAYGSRINHLDLKLHCNIWRQFIFYVTSISFDRQLVTFSVTHKLMGMIFQITCKTFSIWTTLVWKQSKLNYGIPRRTLHRLVKCGSYWQY